MGEPASTGPATEVALRPTFPHRTLGRVLRRPNASAWQRVPVAVLLGAVLVSTLDAGAIRAAAVEPSVARRGACSDVSRWRLKVRSIEGDMLRVRFVIAGGAAGEEWNLFMDHNGVGFFAGSRISEHDGLVVVRRRTEDLDGQDRIRAGAHNTATGETCRGGVSL